MTKLSLYQSLISAGFPSPAENEVEYSLDLNELLINNPAATFFLRVSGNSMVKAGIFDHDIVVVDRSLEPLHGKIVVAVINGELTLKRLYRQEKRVALLAENESYPPLEISEEMELHIWGVVTAAIRKL